MQKLIMVALFGFLIAVQFPARISRAQENSNAPPIPQPVDTFTIPAGTTIQAELTTMLSSKDSNTGDPFSARVVEPVFGGGEEIVPEGSTLDGHVSYVKTPGRVK